MTIQAVTLHDGTLDLEIQFDSGHVLQLIPSPAAYEAWSVRQGDRQFIGIGGGDLSVFGG